MANISKKQNTDDLSHVLKGLKVFVDVRNEKENWSFVYVNLLKELGASVVSKMSENPTHVVFHNGYHRTLNAAKRRNVHLVAVRWVESCKLEGKKVPEEDYPAVMLPAPKEDTFWKLFRKYKILDKMKKEREEKKLKMANDLSNLNGPRESNNIRDEEEFYEEFAKKLMNINTINGEKINDQIDKENTVKAKRDDDIQNCEAIQSDEEMEENIAPTNKTEKETIESHNDIKKENDLPLTPSDENSLKSSQTNSSSQDNNTTDDNDEINDHLNCSNTNLSGTRLDDEVDLGDNELMNSFKTPLLERCLARMTDLPAKNIEHIRNYITSPMYRMRQMQELDKYKIPTEQSSSLEQNKKKVKRRKSHFGTKSLANTNSASKKARKKRISTMNRSIASYFNTPTSTSSSSSAKQSSTPLRATKPALAVHNEPSQHEELPRRNLFDSFRDKLSCDDNKEENILDVLCNSQASNNNINNINNNKTNKNDWIKNENETPQKKKRGVEDLHKDVHKKIKLEQDDNSNITKKYSSNYLQSSIKKNKSKIKLEKDDNVDINNKYSNDDEQENNEADESISDILDDIKLNSVDEFLSLIQGNEDDKNKNPDANLDKSNDICKNNVNIKNDKANNLITKKKRKLLNPQSLVLSHLPSSTNATSSMSRNSFVTSNTNSTFSSFTTSSHNISARNERFKPLTFVSPSKQHKKLTNNKLNSSDINRPNSQLDAHTKHTNTASCLNKQFYSSKPIHQFFSHNKTTLSSQEKLIKTESSCKDQTPCKSDSQHASHSTLHEASPLQALVAHRPTTSSSNTSASNQLGNKKKFFQPPFKFSPKSSLASKSPKQAKNTKPSLTVSIPLPPSIVPSSSSFLSQLSTPSQPLSLAFPSPSSPLSSEIRINEIKKSLNNNSNKKNEKLCHNGNILLVTTSLDKKQKDILKEATAKIGGVENSEVIDRSGVVLVMGEKQRTMKVLRAVCYGCWVLKFDWVSESLKHGAWLRFDDYEADDYYPIVRINRLKRMDAESSNILAELCDEDGQNNVHNIPQCISTTTPSKSDLPINKMPLPSCLIFSSCGPIYIDACCKPPKQELESVVLLCGGKVVTNQRKAAICVGKVVKKYLLNVKETWIVDSLMEGKCLGYNAFLLN